MSNYYNELFAIAQKVFNDEFKDTLFTQEEYGTTLFPQLKSFRNDDATKRHTLFFNPRVEVVLALYNIAVIRHINIGTALAYYILCYECISLDEYDHAREFLTRFSEELKRLQLREKLEEMEFETNSFIRYQILFTLFHEISHEYYRHYEKSHDIATATSKKVMESLRGPYTKVFTEENFAQAMMRDDVKNFILSQIPEGCSDEEMKRIVEEKVALYHYLTDLSTYIGQLLNDKDKQFIDEISCDRNAFVIFMRWAKRQRLPKDMTSLLHDILYLAMNAMDNVKVLQVYCNPPRRERDMPYDPRQIVLRQRALITNRLIFQGKKYREVDEYYTELNSTLEDIMVSALTTMRSHEELICEILGRRENIRMPDSYAIFSLSEDMEDAVSLLFNDIAKPCPLDSTKMLAEDFLFRESMCSLLKRLLWVKLTGRYKD